MKYYFGDNREYGAEDIKAALGVLAANGGIAPELNDGESYDINKLNELIGSAVAEGIVPESNQSLKLEYENGEYFVYPGKAVFSDGGIAVLEEKQTQEIKAGQYLYLVYDLTLDDVYFLTSEEPLEEDGTKLVIPIACVETDGSVKSTRRYAQGKIPALASAKWSTLRSVEFTADVSEIRKRGGYAEAVHQFDGSMNFMLAENNGMVASMHAGDSVRYRTAYRITSTLYGYSEEYIGVDSCSNGIVQGTLLERGDGYIKMRYKVPASYGYDTLKYTAVIGVEAS